MNFRNELEKILQDFLDTYEVGNETILECKYTATQAIINLVDKEREKAFAGGYGAGGGEVYQLDLAWKLYDDAVRAKLKGDSDDR